MLDELDNVFDDHPSLDASLEDFENQSNAHRSPLFGMPSQHSGFRSEESDDEIEEPGANERWSPPGVRRQDHVRSSGWYRHQPYQRKGNLNERLELRPTMGLSMSPSVSREPSPQYEDAVEDPSKGKSNDDDLTDITAAVNVPLPVGAGTPQTGRSPSPRPPQNKAAHTHAEEEEGLGFGAENLSNCRHCLNFGVRW